MAALFAPALASNPELDLGLEPPDPFESKRGWYSTRVPDVSLESKIKIYWEYLEDDGGLMKDRDGLIVPDHWRHNETKWYAQCLSVRTKLSNIFVDGWHERHLKRCKEEAAAKVAVAKDPVTRFSTDYAVAWGKKQGWKVVDRERYDTRTNRHHDLEGGVDVIFVAPGEMGRIGVQGAGLGERKRHYERFMKWGGPETARVRLLSVIYLEFERGDRVPRLREDWA